jgi:hypothetical protein
MEGVQHKQLHIKNGMEGCTKVVGQVVHSMAAVEAVAAGLLLPTLLWLLALEDLVVA